MYIETHLRRRFGCHLPVVVLGICEILDAQRQTFENVPFIYKAARLPFFGLTSDMAKVRRFDGLPKHFILFLLIVGYILCFIWKVYRIRVKI